MALFEPGMGSDRLRLREKRKLSFRSIQSRPGIGISKKIAKKFKKLKNIIMASFQAKIGWERMRTCEKKKLSFRSIQSRPGIGISKKIEKKIEKIKKKKKNINVASFKAKTGRDQLRV